jgi:hypothetical protein
LAEFCRIKKPDWILMEDGFVYVGPFDDAEAAENDQLGFVTAYLTFVKTQRPIIHAGDEAPG